MRLVHPWIIISMYCWTCFHHWWISCLLDANRLSVKHSTHLSTNIQYTDADEDEDEDNDDDDEPCFIIDAKHYGSISRFYNHSCKPNVYTQNVVIKYRHLCICKTFINEFLIPCSRYSLSRMILDFQLLHSLHVDRFELAKVNLDTCWSLTCQSMVIGFYVLLLLLFFHLELCWDYNYTVGCMPDIQINCQCQSSNCRGRLLWHNLVILLEYCELNSSALLRCFTFGND
jgi:hypothetical protein